MPEFNPDDLAELTPEERAEFDELISGEGVLWEPHPHNKPQQEAFECTADVIGYGGAAGGGKTDLGVGLALMKHRVCQVFRREGTELRSLIDRVAEVLGHRRGLGGKPPVWRSPTKTCEVLEFGSVPNLGDETKFQGRAKDLLWFDEASNFLEAQVRFLMGWVRTTDPKQRTLTLLTFNPPTSVEGRWIIEFFAPWLDKKHPRPAESGEIRWFAAVNGKDVEVEDSRPFVLEDEPKTPENPERIYDFDPRLYRKEDIIQPVSRTFIASRVKDNPYLVGTNYMRQLMQLPEPLRSKMLDGDFAAGVEDDPFQVIPTAWVEAAQTRWAKKHVKPVMDSVGVDVAMKGRDKTIIARRHGYWFDEPICYPGRVCLDGPTIAGFVLAALRNYAVIHIDLFGVGAQPYGHLMKIGVQVIGCNVGDPARGLSADGHMQFRNWRSELWWRMREALDPVAAEKTGIALPPGRELLVDLCTPKWSMTNNVLKVQSREEIIKEIGRSPDLGSAYVLGLIDTPKRHTILQLGLRNRRREYDPYADI